MEPKDLEQRFRHHPPKDAAQEQAHSNTRMACWGLAQLLNETLPEGRAKALAFTHLEETMFWANAAIARAVDA